MNLKPLFLVLVLVASPAMAGDRVVDCAITAQPKGEVLYKGKCRFLPEGNGSFSLLHPGQDRFLFGNTFAITVEVVEKGVGQVIASMSDKNGGGHNSRWCEVKRSKTDAACWVGDCVQVCAK